MIRNTAHYNTHTTDHFVSSTVRNRMSQYVNIAKAMMSRGVTSNGRTFNCTFAVKKGKVLAIGVNNYRRQVRYMKQFKTDVRYYGEDNYQMSLHGEISCLLKLGYEDCSDIDFFSIRIDNNNHCRCSQPCKNCERILRMVGFNHIYYFDENMQLCVMRQ